MLQLAVLAASLLIAPLAVAQVEIVNLGASAQNSFIFAGNGSPGGNDWSLVLVNPCRGAGHCTAVGVGPGPLAGSKGFYSFDVVGVTIHGNETHADSWSITENKPIGFDIGTSKGGDQLLQGSLTLVSMQQNGAGRKFNDVLTAKLTVTGGALAQYFSDGGALLTFDIATTQNLMSLPVGTTFATTSRNGEISPAPEPGTFVLLGSGLLAFGGYLRKKMASV